MPLAGTVATHEDAQTIRAVYLAMELIGWFVLVPFALASVLTGLVVSLGNRWGLFRHFWVLAKFAISAIATVILVAYMRRLDGFVDLTAELASSTHHLTALRVPTHLAHAVIALFALLVATGLSVYKPWGLTAYGT